MTAIASAARAGLDAARLQLDASAHRIANAGISRGPAAAQRNAQDGAAAPLAQSGFAASSLAGDLVAQKTAVYAFKANLRTLQAQDQMIGTLLDLRA